MNLISVVILHLLLVPLHVEADTTGQSGYSNVQPTVVVVIVLLGIMSVIAILLLAYVKFCTRREPANRNLPQYNTGLIRSSGRHSGIDKTVVESLPFFKFSSLRGSKDGLECVVCLSKFEDIDVLRLLPKCKHAFHINCIDHWLEKHSSCPLCRHKVSFEDLKLITYSNSMRFLWNNQSELRDQDSNNMELFVQREESHRGSSRFSIGSSSGKIHEKGHHKEEELLVRKQTKADQTLFHQHNHKISVSNFVFKNRWSNLSSSDLVFLNSKMLNDMSSSRFSPTDWNNDMSSTGKAVQNEEIMNVKEEMEFRKSLQSKDGITSASVSSSVMNSREQRSVSEITSFSRFGDFGVENRITESCSVFGSDVREERTRKVWLPIARITVQWFANREKSSQRQSLVV